MRSIKAGLTGTEFFFVEKQTLDHFSFVSLNGETIRFVLEKKNNIIVDEIVAGWVSEAI